MSIMQTLSMALKSITNNKVRSILTMLGIIIGVASVITLVATIQGMQQMNTLMIEAMGTNRIEFDMWLNNKSVRNEIIDYARDDLGHYLNGMTAYTRTGGMPIRYRTKSMDSTTLLFAEESYSTCVSYTIASGRNLAAADIKNRAKVCVIGESVRKNFFGAMSPLGQSIKINGQSVEVIGVLNGKYGGKLNTDDDVVLMPLSLQTRIMGWQNDNMSYIASGKDTDSVKAFTEQLTAYAETKYNPEREYFYVWSSQQSQEMQQQSSNMMSLVAGGVAGISLLVGGIGIMNIMLVSVTERTREIGIRMAIGARRRDIIGQFMIEAGVVSAFGGVIGIAIGIFGTAMLGGLLVRKTMNSPWMPEMPSMIVLPSMPLVVGAFIFSALLGIIFGLYPANKASKMQPVDALRTQ